MKTNKPADPTKETSKDDSSDIQKVKKQTAPPQGKANTKNTGSQQREDEEAQKGHS